ncbi:hypothetical protein DPX39_000018900 [Trypanosoma brucei equiperdum]|uniref:Uncharacterized protein n=1 Tax=Trypanosoma brucei equiperdum TaxID=630700 RepID=A0A3L6KS64_9TRYP|nr:hypothetical protein DPX39_000018900 [Trypanosoma brucei equiperdum]
MPATSTWCQGPVPRIIEGYQEPAAFLSWGTLLCSGYGIIQHRDQQRLSGTPFFIFRSLDTCQRAISNAIRTKMLLSGDVEENPGPSLRGMQWNCAGLSQGKRLTLHKTLVDERIAFCLLSETRMTPGETACFSVASYQHHGIARNCKGGGVSILVREDLPVETGMAIVGRIEQVHATIHLARGTSLTVTSAYIPPKHTFTATDIDKLLTTDGAQLSLVQTLTHTRWHGIARAHQIPRVKPSHSGALTTSFWSATLVSAPGTRATTGSPPLM